MTVTLQPAGPADMAAAPPPAAAPLEASLRRFPFPYRAILAICSDLDDTPDETTYFETARYLNTTDRTLLGAGVGLEVGNSMYFDMRPGRVSYWNLGEAGRAKVRALIHSGHIDCLHSYGDLATRRRHAGRALDELSRYGCRLQVWVDHAAAPSNFGSDIMCGQGDAPGSPVYHADLTRAYGIRYVWRGRVTSVIGQSVPRSLAGLYDPRHRLASIRTTAKELIKGIAGRSGWSKYAMHGVNDLMRDVRLRDGGAACEFMRMNPSWLGVDQHATAPGLAQVLTPGVLDHLAGRGAVAVLYTHLGKIAARRDPFPAATRSALEELARRSHEGQVLVTTTRRLLGYWRAVTDVRLSPAQEGHHDRVDLVACGADRQPIDEADLDGITVYVRDPERARLFVNGRERQNIRRNAPDHTGRASISLPWRRPEFPRP